MNGWRDRILASALFIVLAAAIGTGTGVALVGQRQGGEFSLQDQDWLRNNYPSGRYLPDRESALFYQVCIDNSWHRFYANGLRTDQRVWCWK